MNGRDLVSVDTPAVVDVLGLTEQIHFGMLRADGKSLRTHTSFQPQLADLPTSTVQQARRADTA